MRWQPYRPQSGAQPQLERRRGTLYASVGATGWTRPGAQFTWWVGRGRGTGALAQGETSTERGAKLAADRAMVRLGAGVTNVVVPTALSGWDRDADGYQYDLLDDDRGDFTYRISRRGDRGWVLTVALFGSDGQLVDRDGRIKHPYVAAELHAAASTFRTPMAAAQAANRHALAVTGTPVERPRGNRRHR